MKKLLIILCVLFLNLGGNIINAYDFKHVSLNGGADINANYLFRGSTYGGLNLQPWIELNYKWFTLGVWNNVGFGNYFEKFNTLVPETDVYFSVTCPGDWVTLSVTHYYYYDESKFFGYKNDDSNSTQTELGLEIRFSQDYPVILSANTMIGGGDCYAWDGTFLDKKLYSTYISIRYEYEASETIYLEPEIGFSPYKSCYTYYNPETGEHLPFAVNNISLKGMYTVFSGNILNLSILGHIHVNLFNLGNGRFTDVPGTTFGWNVGICMEL